MANKLGALRVAAVGAVVLLGGACGGSQAGDTSKGGSDLQAALRDRSFVSESVEGWVLVPGTEVRIAFRRSELSANAGCNHLSGSFAIDGDTLTMHGISTTEMGCDPPRHEQDAWLGAFLSARPVLVLTEPRLVMTTSDARMTLLDREVASPDRPLAGTQWIGDGFGDGSGVSIGPGSDLVRAFFDPNGSVTIHTSCQIGSGTYQVDGMSLTFAGFSYDGAPCADASHQQTSDQVLLVIDGSPVSFEIEERSLAIQRGNDILYFRAAE
jgi:heat shock protein HslJ